MVSQFRSHASTGPSSRSTSKSQRKPPWVARGRDTSATHPTTGDRARRKTCGPSTSRRCRPSTPPSSRSTAASGERFSLAGGEVRVYDCADIADARWAAWIGPWHMAHGMFHAPRVEQLRHRRHTEPGEVDRHTRGTDRRRRSPVQPGEIRLPPRRSRCRHHIRRVEAGHLRGQRGFRAGAASMSGPARYGGFRRHPTGDAEPLLLVTDTAVVTLTPWDAPGGSRGARGRRHGTGCPRLPQQGDQRQLGGLTRESH